MHIFCNKRFKAFLEGQTYKDKPTFLRNKILLIWSGSLSSFLHSHIFLYNIYSQQFSSVRGFFFKKNDINGI